MPIATTYDPSAPSAVTGQGPSVANREDLSDVLTVLAPEETPILSMASKSRAKSTYAEWTVDKLASPRSQGRSEGEDYSSFDNKSEKKARLGNYVQEEGRPWMVSKYQEAADQAGPADVAKSETQCMREVKRDFEYAIAADQEMQAEDGANNYKMRGLGYWLQATAQSTNPVPSDYRTPSASIGTGSSLTDTGLNDIISSVFSVTGNTNGLTLVAARVLRSTISEFTRAEGSTTAERYVVNQDAAAKTITLAVDTFDSDFGMISIVNGNPDCMPGTRRGYLLNPEFIEVKQFIPFGSTRFENQGGGERGACDGTLTLCVRHPGAHGKIA